MLNSIISLPLAQTATSKAIQVVTQMPVPTEQTAAQTDAATTTEQFKYSLQSFFEWHQQIFSNIADWCALNWLALLACIVKLLIVAVFCFLLRMLLRKIIIPFIEKWFQTASKELMAVSTSFIWLVFVSGMSRSVGALPFSDATHTGLNKIFYIIFTLTFLGIFLRVLKCLAAMVIDRFKQQKPENYNMNKLLLDLSTSVVRLIVWTFVIFFILQEVLRMNVTHLLASAGIFGFGVALAAKDTISNIFGAFSILGSKIFKVGDRIKVGSAEGYVERIGFRSIEIRALDGRTLDIPNHIVADSQIENFSKRHFWREQFCFGLVYSTTPEQMKLAKKILHDIGHDLSDLMANGKPVKFDFMLFDNCSLNLEGFVWFKAADVLALRTARGRFNEEVLKRFNEAGIEIAFPTTTVIMESQEKK